MSGTKNVHLVFVNNWDKNQPILATFGKQNPEEISRV